MTDTATPATKETKPDMAKWIIAGILITVALVSFLFARKFTGPIDSVITKQACSVHGNDLNRRVTSYEKAGGLGIFNTTDGTCTYGPVDTSEVDVNEIPVPEIDDETGEVIALPLGSDADPEAPLQLAIDDIQPGGTFTAAKLMVVLMQFGVASVAVRSIADPLLDRFA